MIDQITTWTQIKRMTVPILDEDGYLIGEEKHSNDNQRIRKV